MTEEIHAEKSRIVRSAIAEVLCRSAEDIRDQDRIVEDLGLDSLEFLSVVQAIESRTLIRLTDEVAAQALTVEDLIQVLDNAEWA